VPVVAAGFGWGIPGEARVPWTSHCWVIWQRTAALNETTKIVGTWFGGDEVLVAVSHSLVCSNNM